MVSILRGPAAFLASTVSLVLWTLLTMGQICRLLLSPFYKLIWFVLEPTGLPTAAGHFATEHRYHFLHLRMTVCPNVKIRKWFCLIICVVCVCCLNLSQILAGAVHRSTDVTYI